MSGTLFLIPATLGIPDPANANPLGMLIPEQVAMVTARLDYFIAENAKTARAHLKTVSLRHPLAKPLQEIRFGELNVNTGANDLPTLLEPLLAGRDAGLISEAGVPAVADPGANLVRLAHARGIPVKPLVGPSSLLLALMASGLNGQSFAFNGYLPIDAAQRIKRVKLLEERSRKERQTQMFIETPYRNGGLIETLAAHCQPATLICVATDLSLAEESIVTQSAAAWKQALASGKAPDLHKRPSVFLLLAD